MAGRARPAAELLASALRPERARVGALSVVLVVAMLLPIAGPIIIGRFVDEATAGAPLSELTTLAAMYFVLAIGVEVLQLVLTWASVRMAWRLGNRLREQLSDHALHHDLAWHGKHSPGELISRIDGDIEALTNFFSKVVVHIIGNGVLVVGVVVASLVLDWRVGAVLALTTSLTMAVVLRFRAVAVEAHEADRAAAASIYADVEERLGGLEDLRANGAGGYAVHRLLGNSSRAWHTLRSAFLRGDGSFALSAGVFAAGTTLALAASIGLHRSGVLTVGAVLALFRYSMLARQPIERVAEQLPELQKALAGASRAAALLAEPVEIEAPPAGRARRLPDGALSLELRDVTLTYDEDDEPALHDLRLSLTPGTTLGVVGRTGSGKTSIGRVLLRLWDPTAGAVMIGGVDLRDLAPDELRRRTAVVTQEVELFRASVRDNLTVLGALEVDDARLRRVLREIGLGDWLTDLPDGLDTPLDPEGGTGLSAGEAQLLAFARALLRDPGLVVLDEASSRLDPETERRLTAVTDRLLAGRTAVVIAHRLSTLDRVDEIAVVEAGRVVEHGDRRRLAADPASRYARLRALSPVDLLADEGAVA